MTETVYEKMPDDVKESLMGMGMDAEQAEACGILSQKIKDFALDNIVEGDMVSAADMIVASVAAEMAGEWLKYAAQVVAMESLLEDLAEESDE